MTIIDDLIKEKKEKYFKNTLYIIASVIAVSFFGTGFYIFADYINHNGIQSFNNLSAIGSYLSGTAGVLFSAATIILLIINLIMSRDELKLQREEMAKQKEIFDKQMRSISIEQSENTLFKLIENHKKYIDALYDTLNKGSALLEEKLNYYRSRLSNYHIQYANKRFDNYKLQFIQPHIFFSDKKNKDFYIPIFNSIKLVVEYIDIQFKENLKTFITDEKALSAKMDFYHSVFYHSLTNFERYFIGFFHQNSIIFDYPNLNKLYLDYYKLEPNNFKFSEAIKFLALDLIVSPNNSKVIEFSLPHEYHNNSSLTLPAVRKGIDNITIIDKNQENFNLINCFIVEDVRGLRVDYTANNNLTNCNIFNQSLMNKISDMIDYYKRDDFTLTFEMSLLVNYNNANYNLKYTFDVGVYEKEFERLVKLTIH